MGRRAHADALAERVTELLEASQGDQTTKPDTAPPTLDEIAELQPGVRELGLEAAAAYCYQLQAEIKAKQETRDQILEQINAAAEELRLPPRVMGNDGLWEIRKARGGGAKKIVAEKLLQHGVTMDVIEAATVTGATWEKYTIFTVPAKKGGGRP
jgi:hypothetical protein